MSTALKQTRSAVGNIHQIVIWDTEFHAAIISCSQNQLIDQAMSLIFDRLTQARHRMHSAPSEVEHSWRRARAFSMRFPINVRTTRRTRCERISAASNAI